MASAQNSPRLYPLLPSPKAHPLYDRHHTKPPELSLFSSLPSNNSSFVPGFAAIRGLNMDAPEAWVPLLDLYMNPTEKGGLDLCNMIWPGYQTAFSPNWPQLATLLQSRNIPATDLGGFVPGGVQDFDVHLAPAFEQGRRVMGPLFLGFDMGEQDVRYLWGYAHHALLPGPQQRFDQYMKFIDYSWNIEYKANGTLAALSSSVYAVHHWLKSGLYTLAGSETSQSNGNAQVLYAFVRGAAKQVFAV